MQGATKQLAERRLGSSFADPEHKVHADRRAEVELVNRTLADPDARSVNEEYAHEFYRLFTPAAKNAGVQASIYSKLHELGPKAAQAYQVALRKHGRIYNESVQTDTPSEGGIFVPRPEYAGIYRERARKQSFVRAQAQVIMSEQGQGSTMKFPVHDGRATAIYVDSRNDNWDETKLATVKRIELGLHRAIAKIKMPFDFYSDAPEWAANFYMRKCVEAISDHQASKYTEGDGVGEPRGILDLPLTDVALDPDLDKIQRVKTGVAGKLPTASQTQSPVEPFIKALQGVKSPMGMAWGFGRTSTTVIRSTVNTQGNLYWRDSVMSGNPDMLLGYPSMIDDFIDNIDGTSTTVVNFGLLLNQGAYAIMRKAGEGVELRVDNITGDAYAELKWSERDGGVLLVRDEAVVLRAEA